MTNRGTISTIHLEVELELNELQKLGFRGIPRTLEYARTHRDEVEEYRENGMRISEIADLIRDLANL